MKLSSLYVTRSFVNSVGFELPSYDISGPAEGIRIFGGWCTGKTVDDIVVNLSWTEGENRSLSIQVTKEMRYDWSWSMRTGLIEISYYSFCLPIWRIKFSSRNYDCPCLKLLKNWVYSIRLKLNILILLIANSDSHLFPFAAQQCSGKTMHCHFGTMKWKF